MHAHLQDQDVAGGGLEGVEKANEERVLEVLQDAELMGDLVALHQLLVHELCGHSSSGSFLITFLNDSESAPMNIQRRSFPEYREDVKGSRQRVPPGAVTQLLRTGLRKTQ